MKIKYAGQNTSCEHLLLILFDPLLTNSVLLFRRKVDWRILPLFGVLGALSLIDRGNISFAREAGMDHDLVSLS